ncbi:hypothetical protein KIPB_015278, partial [Kipferlia bialata]
VEVDGLFLDPDNKRLLKENVTKRLTAYTNGVQRDIEAHKMYRDRLVDRGITACGDSTDVAVYGVVTPSLFVPGYSVSKDQKDRTLFRAKKAALLRQTQLVADRFDSFLCASESIDDYVLGDKNVKDSERPPSDDGEAPEAEAGETGPSLSGSLLTRTGLSFPPSAF